MSEFVKALRLKIAILTNRFLRRQGLSFRDQVAKVIMHTCSLQLEREETRELAPAKSAFGPMKLSGGAITTIVYRVFDVEADKIDKTIKSEPWRAFAQVTMRLTLDKDPEFTVQILSKADTELPDGHFVDVEPRAVHKAPGVALISHLAEYFPLIARPHQGPVIAPMEVAR